MGDALHQAAVAADRVDVEVEELGAVARRQPLRGDRHADRGRDALAERAGRRLDARGPAVLGVARRLRVELAEALDVVEADGGVADDLVVGVDRPHPGEVQQRVEQHRGVAGGEHEAVAAGPDRVGRVEAQEALPERVGDRRERHRRPGMAGVRLLDRVDRERADRVDAELVDVLGHDLDRSYSIDASQLRSARHGSIRVTAPSPLSATQTASPPTATALGWRPTAIGSPLVSPLAMSIRLTLSSAAFATQTTLVPASIPPGRRPTGIGAPSSSPVAVSTRVTVSVRLLATQTTPPATVIPDGPRPTLIGCPGERGAQVDAAHRAGGRVADPDAAGADREPQRRLVGSDVAPDDLRPPVALIAVTPPRSSSATQTRSPPKTRAPGCPPTSIRCSTVPVSPSISQDLAGARAGDPDRFGPDRDAGDAPSEVQQRAFDETACRRRSGSGCRRGRSSPRPSARRSATRSGPRPTAIGAETETLSPPKSCARRSRRRSRPAGGTPIAAPCALRGPTRRRRSPPTRSDQRSAAPACLGEHPGRRRASRPGARGRRRSAPPAVG